MSDTDKPKLARRDVEAELEWRRAKRALLAVLAGSWAVRIALAARGGQYFFPDETRFDRSLEFVRTIRTGHVADALRQLVARADHTGWTVVGLVPAGLASMFGSATHRPPEQFAYMVAMLLSLASVASIALVFLLARRLGASAGESLAAAVLLSLTGSFFYWSRHLVPYDTSMALALLATWVGLARGRLRRSFATGLLAGCAFSVYNGYWTIAILAVAIHAAVGARYFRRTLARAAVGLVGFVVPTLALLAAVRLAGAGDGLTKMRAFAGTVTQGDWADGFSLPVDYLWSADRLVFVVSLLAIGVVVGWHVWSKAVTSGLRQTSTTLFRRRPGASPELRASLLLGCIVFIYASLAGGAAVVRVFVVYGRLARQLVPFLCLLTGCVAVAAYRRGFLRGSVYRAALAIAAVVQVAIAFGPPLRQVFPRELEARLFDYRPLDYALTITGPDVRPGDPAARFVLVNAQYLYPPRGHQSLPGGSVVFSVPHPFSYAPYRYEGFRAYEREILTNGDISIRLVDRSQPAHP